MRQLAAGLAAHLGSGTTTLCHCWRLETVGGDVMGFTDHDRDLSFDGMGFEAEAGFTATEIESSLGLAVDNLEASGALSSERLNAARLLAGDFDNAAIEVWMVNWQDVSQRSLLRRGNLGEITRGPAAFTAELRGLAHALNQPRGRIYQYGCDAVLGDARCGVDLEAAAFSIEAIVQRRRRRRLRRSRTAAGGDGCRILRREFLRAGERGIRFRSQCGAAERNQVPSPSCNGNRNRVMAADGFGDRSGRLGEIARRLRQAVFHLPREVRQWRELPRLPAYSGR